MIQTHDIHISNITASITDSLLPVNPNALTEKHMAKHRKITYDKTYEGYPINTNIDKGYGCDTRILNALQRTLDSSLEDSSKVLVIRYDVRLPVETPEDEGTKTDDGSNEVIKKLQGSFCKHLSRKGLKPKYVAVRERVSSNNPHYHVALTLDGQKTQSAYNHMKKAEELLGKQLGLDPERPHGLIERCPVERDGQPDTDAYMLKRGDQEGYDEVFYRCSYLAKVACKPADGVRELFVSKRPKKKQAG